MTVELQLLLTLLAEALCPGPMVDIILSAVKQNLFCIIICMSGRGGVANHHATGLFLFLESHVQP